MVVPRAPGGARLLYATGGGCPLSVFHIAPPAGPDEGPLSLACPALRASLAVTLLFPDGRPVPDACILVERGADVIPSQVLAAHPSSPGLPVETDGSGHLELAGLEPGHNALFLALAASEATIAGGPSRCFLASIELPPASAEEPRITVGE